MAKIKSEKYTFDGKEITINFNCSSKGIFSVSVPPTIQDKLGIDSRKLEGLKLEEIESTIREAYIKYVDSKTELKLKIGVTFGCSGDYAKDLTHDKKNHKIGYLGSEFNSALSFDYRVIIEETRNDNVSRYEAKKHLEHLDDAYFKYKKSLGGYVETHQLHTNNRSEKIIPFSESALENLELIKNQLKKASIFLIGLVTDECFESIINNTSEIKLLTNGK